MRPFQIIMRLLVPRTAGPRRQTPFQIHKLQIQMLQIQGTCQRRLIQLPSLRTHNLLTRLENVGRCHSTAWKVAVGWLAVFRQIETLGSPDVSGPHILRELLWRRFLLHSFSFDRLSRIIIA